MKKAESKVVWKEGSVEVEADDGDRERERGERKPEWQHKSGGRKKNGRGVGSERRREEEMPKHEVVTLV